MPKMFPFAKTSNKTKLNKKPELERWQLEQPNSQPPRSGNYRIHAESGEVKQVDTKRQGNYRIHEDSRDDFYSIRSSLNQNKNRVDRDNLFKAQPVKEKYNQKVYQDNLRMIKSRSQGNYRVGSQGYNNHNYSTHRSESNKMVTTKKFQRDRRRKIRPTFKWGKLPQGRPKLFAVYSILLMIMFICVLQLLPFKRVNQVRVSGVGQEIAQQVKASSRIEPFDSRKLVLRQRNEIIEQIKKENPIVDQVQIKTDHWSFIELAVTSNEFVAEMPDTVQNQKNYVLSNGDVVIIPMTDERNAVNLPVLYDFDNRDKLKQVGQALKEIDQDLLGQMQSIYLSTNSAKPNTIEIKMVDGNIVKALIYNVSQKMQYYPQILNKIGDKKGIVNFEVGAYFTPNDSPDNSVKLDTNIDN
ncbi:cell division protein FtsQ/DivIB [Eremococcus coleocola]|uniref:cell division protein FtsQ/DivIB n=1 Tax=Eremococcus coleocola TaxID=88132 RepID=UPI00041E2725|nr:cell division protein FtsQ/DivIB [Eremococcus coleocola]